jgi:thiol-disulfide isomerase/thioredoxin
LEQELVGKEGTESFGSLLQKTKPKLLAVYYSMHTCPPCREFTPLLAALYEEINEDEKQLEVVFFSGDKTDEQFEEYFAEMPWLALPRSQQKLMRDNAKEHFKVSGVPTLAMIRVSDGEILSKQCYQKLKDEGPMALEEFL